MYAASLVTTAIGYYTPTLTATHPLHEAKCIDYREGVEKLSRDLSKTCYDNRPYVILYHKLVP